MYYEVSYHFCVVVVLSEVAVVLGFALDFTFSRCGEREIFVRFTSSFAVTCTEIITDGGQFLI